MAINRYKQLLTSVPKGNFYASDGQVLPYRDSPYVLRINTEAPNTEYNIYVNEIPRGSVTTGGDAIATVNILLDKGRNDIKLVNTVTQNVTKAYITTRIYATMLAGIAESIETLDAGIEQVLLDSRLLTSSAFLIEDVFGKTVKTANNAQYGLDTYRELIQELRAAYRYYGGTIEGVSRAVRAFTQISPLTYPITFGPTWVLGKDLISPKIDTSKFIVYPTAVDLTALQGTGAGVNLHSIGADLPLGAATITIDGTASPFKKVYTSLSTASNAVSITGNGTYTIYNTTVPTIYSEPGPFNIVASTNDVLVIDVGGRGVISISLTAGAAVTPAQLATDINNAMSTDTRYTGLASIAVDDGNYLLLSAPTIQDEITIYSSSAVATVFNIPTDLLPFRRQKITNINPVTITIDDISKLPSTVEVGTFTVSGSGLPEGWYATDSGGVPISVGGSVYSNFNRDRDLPFTVPPNSILNIPIPNEILKYKGFKLRLQVAAAPYDPTVLGTPVDISTIQLSFDDQTTFSSIVPTVTGSYIPSTLQPRLYTVEMLIPSDATRVWVRINTDAGAGNCIIHKVRATIPTIHSGLHLADRTIPRNESKIKHGSFMYVWCKDILTSHESAQIGVNSTGQDGTSHIDRLMPDFTWVDKFNASVYSGALAINVHGAFTDAEFMAGTMINVDLILRSPDRFTHLRPAIVNEQEETAVFTTVAPYTYTLGIPSNQDQATAILFENDQPLYRNEWRFNSATEIELLVPPNPLSVYTLRHQALIRFETGTIDLGANYTNYVWFADGHIWLRPEIVPISVNITTGIQFDGSGVATLPEQSNKDQSTATLVEDTGLSKTTVSSSYWSFVDGRRVRITPSVLNPSALYTMQYTALVNHPAVQATYQMEIKSAASEAGLAAAIWTNVEPNQVIDNTNRYHQMRVTINNVRDLRDVRIQSLVIKGLELFGTGTVPVLKP